MLRCVALSKDTIADLKQSRCGYSILFLFLP